MIKENEPFIDASAPPRSFSNPNSQPKNLNLRKILKFLLYLLVIIVILFAARHLFPDDPAMLVESLRSFQQQGFIGNFVLTFVGVLIVLLGLPFLYFELGIGFLSKSYWGGCAIVFTSKTLAILISYFLSKYLIREWLLSLVRNDKYYHLIHLMYERNRKTSLSLIAILFIPFFIKNYGVPLLDVHLKDYLIYYVSVNLLFSSWYVYLGTKLDDLQAISEQGGGGLVIGMIIITIAAMLGIGFYSRNLMKELDKEKSRE